LGVSNNTSSPSLAAGKILYVLTHLAFVPLILIPNSTAAFNIIMWGLVLSCFAAVENYSGALAIRFFLGVFESAVTPGFALFTSQWYTKKEQGARTGIWFSFNGWAQVRISHHSPQTNIRIVDGD
jgi:MFS family permease